MPSPFEDPRKSEMREHFKIALDGAGYEVVDDPVPVPFPEESGLKGAILGDLQSLDGEQIRFAYFLRLDPGKPVPQWLANMARFASDHGDIRVYVVVTEVTSTIERTCRACGAGLLLLTVEHGIDEIVTFGAIDPAKRKTDFEKRVKDIRRRLDTKLDLNLKNLEANFNRVSELTQGMPPNIRDEYIEDVESSGRRWRDWADEISVRLDAVNASQDENELATIDRLIKEGAVLEADE
ncbi:MAG: hypothetical protein M3082_05545 [Candidatus Dormibacteraeota bacterium]|nr:hypothetical protein [Candidatus Dormibacteraeota bacterium]